MPRRRSISEIMADGKSVEAAMRRGVRQALIEHIHAGQPVVEWRNGKTVWVWPEELKKIVRKMDAELGPRNKPAGRRP